MKGAILVYKIIGLDAFVHIKITWGWGMKSFF